MDALAVPGEFVGFRTMFNSFHHFRPGEAQMILADAVSARQPIGIFEIPERFVLVMVPLLLTPIIVALTTPFIRPFRWPRLLGTYLIPLVPLTCLWDGIVSQLRAYTVAELEGLTANLAGDSYCWRTGCVPIPATRGHVTYLVGYPRPTDIEGPVQG